MTAENKQDILLNRKTFSYEVSETVEMLDVSFREACLIVCEKFEVDPSDVKRLITPEVKEEIEQEARKACLLTE